MLVDERTFPMGATDVQFTASDNGGGSGMCTTVVTVVDVTPPTVSCQATEPSYERSQLPLSATASIDDACATDVVVAELRCVTIDAAGDEVEQAPRAPGPDIGARPPFDDSWKTKRIKDGGSRIGTVRHHEQGVFMTANAAFWNKIAVKYSRQPVGDPDCFDRKIAETKARMTAQDVVLGIGCGTGSLALRLAPFAAQVHGLDISSEMIRIARDK